MPPLVIVVILVLALVGVGASPVAIAELVALDTTEEPTEAPVAATLKPSNWGLAHYT